jgi:hypothetical protein
MNDPPKTGTLAKIYGWACPNPECDYHQGIVFYGFSCQYCGTLLRKASAAVAVFSWEDDSHERKGYP